MQSPVHAARAAVTKARDEQDAATVTLHRNELGQYVTADGVWVIERDDEHWRTCEPHIGCDGHDVRFTVWNVADTRTGFMAEWCDGYDTLREAKAALARHITR